MRDEEPLDDVDSELWSDFVRSLVPPGVAQLFFFDGEKIKRLAEEDTEALALGESIKALLGLDLVERLQADLDVFRTRQARRTAHAKAARRLRDLDKELRNLLGQLHKTDEDAAHKAEEHAELESKILRVEEGLAQRGEGLASRREICDRTKRIFPPSSKRRRRAHASCWMRRHRSFSASGRARGSFTSLNSSKLSRIGRSAA